MITSENFEKELKKDSKIIEVSKSSDIPKDYNGLIAVPITFIYKYN